MTTTMKNATKHADALKSLLKKLLKQQEVPEKTAQQPLRALVQAIFSFDSTDARGDDALKVIDEDFVDLNELRVATELELQEIFGPRFSQIERRVGMVTQCLNHIFEREHTLNLERIKTLPKKEIRQFLRDLPGIHPFVEAYVMLYGFDANAFPIDDASLEFLIDEGVLDAETKLDEAQKFIENHLKDDDAYQLFYCIRHRKKK